MVEQMLPEDGLHDFAFLNDTLNLANEKRADTHCHGSAFIAVLEGPFPFDILSFRIKESLR